MPEHLSEDYVDNVLLDRRDQQHDDDPTEPSGIVKDVNEFLPEEVQSLPHEGRDVLQRLLEFDGQKRLHSVRALQRIAMYKDFKIDAKYILNVSTKDI